MYRCTHKKLVMPPRTADGMATRDAANLAKTPMMIRNMLSSHQSCHIVDVSQEEGRLTSNNTQLFY